MRKKLIIALMCFVTAVLLIFVYACIFRQDIVARVFHEKITSPAAIVTALVIGFGSLKFIIARARR